MKKIITTIVFIGLFLALIYYSEPIQQKFITLVSDVKKLNNGNINDYARKDSFNFVETTKVIKQASKVDLYNLYYSVLDVGYKNYQFYCEKTYKNCLSDVNELSKDDTTLSNINSFVAPFNSFETTDNTIQ